MAPKIIDIPIDVDLRADPQTCAERAGLSYVSEGEPGYVRRRHGRGFAYLDPRGKHVRSERERARIKDLVIPPAWTNVWVSRDPNGHIQATGRDAEGRKQYIYHSAWERIRHEVKFNRTIAFGNVLPTLRKRCDADLRRHGLPREKALAAVVYLLDRTLIRVGNREYAERNGSFGLTTLRDRHVDFAGTRCTFRFQGKSGKEHLVELQDQRLARIVRRCRDVPGQTLFQYYTDEGGRSRIDSLDVNAYIREATGEPFTAKDFRTWGASVQAAVYLNGLEEPESERAAEKQIVAMVKEIAGLLGNTPTICRQYYIHPEIVNSYREGRLRDLFGGGLKLKPLPHLDPEEVALLHFFRETCAT